MPRPRPRRRRLASVDPIAAVVLVLLALQGLIAFAIALIG